jgi:hypothetical protein
MKALDSRLPPDVQQIVTEMSHPDSDVLWRSYRGWLVTRIEDEDEDELVVCWVMSRIRVPKQEQENE